nr:MAG TPA: hypothetical protein [Caudoviricetes sp.]
MILERERKNEPLRKCNSKHRCKRKKVPLSLFL